MNIDKYLSKSDIFQYKVFSTADIPFSPAVTEACRRNACGMYGKKWTCPPGVGDPEELERKIKSRPFAAVFTCKYDIEDSFDFEGMIAGQKQAKRVFRSVTDAMRAAGEDFLRSAARAVTCAPSAPTRMRHAAFRTDHAPASRPAA